MPKNRPLLALGIYLLFPLILQADTPPPEPPAASTPAADPPTEAEVALDEAIGRLRDLKGVEAEVAQTADMLGQRFTIKGRYLKSTGHRNRLELSVSGLGNSAGQMVQACDGETLWEYQKIQEGARCTRLAVGEVFKKLDAPEFDAPFRDQVLSGLGFAGPEALLAGLRKAIHFDRKEPGTLEIQVAKGKTEPVAVWILKGEWKDRDALTAPGQAPLPPTGPLPPFVPSVATVSLGQADGWPYKVQLDGRARSGMLQPRQTASDRPVLTKPGPATQERPSRLVLIYGNVRLSPTFTAADFFFQPPASVSVLDQTKEVVDRLDRRRIELEDATRNQAETEKAAPSLEVPVPRLEPGGK